MPSRKAPRGPGEGYRAKRRQILDKAHEANIPLPTSKRNKAIITRYHNLLFGQTVKIDGRKRKKTGLLSRDYNIQKFTPRDAAIVKKTLTFHGRTVNKGLPRLGNVLITQPGRVRVLKNTVKITRGVESRYLPRIDNKDFVASGNTADRMRAFERAVKKKPKGKDIAIRMGTHVLPGTYADIPGARAAYLALAEEYEDDDTIDISIEFVDFEGQDDEL